MASPARPRNAGASQQPDSAFSGTDKVVIQDGTFARAGYTHKAAWSTELLQGLITSPPILFRGKQETETVPLRSIKAFFVKSLDTRDHPDPIHFHDNMRHPELLWVRLRLRAGERLEGLIANSEGLLLHDMLMLIPTDPQTNNQQIVFPRDDIREFQVLGVRPAIEEQH